MIRRLAASLGLCGAIALTAGLTLTMGNNVAFDDETEAVTECMVQARGGASGMTTLRREVSCGDTLLDMPVDAGSSMSEADRVVDAMSNYFSPQRLQVGQTLEVILTPDVVAGHPVIASLSLSLEDGSFIVVECQSGNTFSARQSDTPVPTGETVAQAESTIGPFLKSLASCGAQIEQYRIASGDTLMDLMIKAGATVVDADRASQAMATQYNERRLQIGQSLYVIMTPGLRDSGLQVLGMAILDAGEDGLVITLKVDAGSDFIGFPANDNLDVAMLATLLGKPQTDDVEDATRFDGGLTVETLSLERGDTIMTVLLRAGAGRVEADRAIRAVREHIDPQRLHIGQEIRIAFATAGDEERQLVAVSIGLDDNDFVQADRSGSGFVGRRTATALNPGLALTLQAMPGPNETPIPDGDNEVGDDTVVAVHQRDGGYQLRRASSHVDLADFQVAAVDESQDLDAATAAAIVAVWPDAPPDLSVETAAFGSGDTLMDMLLDLGVDQIEAHNAVEALRDVYNPRHIRAGQDMDVILHGGALYGVMLRTAPGKRVDVALAGDGFTARVVEMPMTATQVAAEGEITSSLYQATVDVGVPPTVLADMIRAYSFDVDFQREIKVGDSFALLYEEYVDEDGNVVRYGSPTYAILRVSGTTLPIYRYTPASGFADYFNDLGESVRKALLRTPVDGARITSGFGMRDHPLLGYSRMHKGVDFGASAGTPILAAGDGVIEFIGRNSGYGNYMRIRHNDTYKTAYAHMQGFASSLGQGSRVRQGQVIGYVGSTGISTGPHLHYEVMVRNEQINPLDVKLPSGEKLDGAELAAFLQVRDALDAQYAELLSERYVAGTP